MHAAGCCSRWPVWRGQRTPCRRPACATWPPACAPPTRSTTLPEALTLSCLPCSTRQVPPLGLDLPLLDMLKPVFDDAEHHAVCLTCHSEETVCFLELLFLSSFGAPHLVVLLQLPAGAHEAMHWLFSDVSCHDGAGEAAGQVLCQGPRATEVTRQTANTNLQQERRPSPDR